MREFTTGLSDAERERLAWLAEECGEVIKAVGKILRHGYDSQYDSHINRLTLEIELGHVGAAGGLMLEAGDMNKHNIIVATERKKETVAQYLHFQK